MRRKWKQIVGITFLLLALLTSLIPASFVQAVGNTSDFEKDGDSIISYTGTATTVSVPVGTVTICAESFSNHTEIKTLSIPASVTTIENGAFRGCTGLEEVFLGNGLETLESGAFSMCTNLKKITFSNTLYQLGAGVFSGDIKLETIDLNKNPNFVLSDGALYNKDMTKLYFVLSGREEQNYKMSDCVTEVERYAFWGCENLRNVELSSNLDLIPEYAFSNCNNLETVSIPYSVRKIAAKAFEDCSSIRNITIPASVSYIHPTAFDGCSNVRILAQEGTTAYEFARSLEEARALGIEADSLSQNTIGSLYNEKKESNSDAVTSESEEESNQKRKFDPSKPADVSDADVSEYYAQDSDDLYGKTRVVNNQAVVLMDAPKQSNEVTKEDASKSPSIEYDSVIEDIFGHELPFKAYYQSNLLNKSQLQKGFLSIGDLAFARSSLKAIKMPEGLQTIGYGAFYHCDQLKEIEIPSTVTDIEPEAFSYTAYMNAFQKGDASDPYLIVGDGILIGYRGDASTIQIPSSVKKIAGGTFRNHAELTRVSIPSTVTEIGEGAFSGCTSLSQIDGLDGVETIKDRAFYDCPLNQIHIPASVKQIGLGAFSGASAGAVVFLGNTDVPCVSYEKTATRLDNESFRISPFSNTNIAVVSNKVADFEKTILDPNLLGLKGLTVSILSDEQKTVSLLKCTMLPNEVTGVVSVPENVKIDGETYRIAQINTNAFEPYLSYDNWSDIPLKNITIPADLGTINDFVPSLNLGFSIEEIDTETTTEDTQTEDSASAGTDGDSKEEEAVSYIETINNASYSNGEKAIAICQDDTTKYQFLLSDASDSEKLMNEVSATYGPLVSGQLQSIDLKLIDQKTQIPISLFGKKQIEIWLPVSDTLYSQDICVVTLKESGELETIYGVKKKKDDINYFVFRTNHFSTYGIYAGLGEVASVIRLESKNLLQKDQSPDTGEKWNPKWFLVIGFTAIGLLLILNRRRVGR